MRGYNLGYGDEGNIYPFLKERILKSIDGYPFIEDKYIPEPGAYSTKITLPDRTIRSGKYLHRLVTFTFGDKDGRPYSTNGIRSVIDHIDMNHENNAVSNLQLVSNGINLFRAYYKCKSESCEKRFKDYYNSLDEIDKKILDTEILLDLQGKY